LAHKIGKKLEKNVLRPIGKFQGKVWRRTLPIATGALGGFLTGGPMGAIMGGATGLKGALQKGGQPVTFGNLFKSAGMGALGGLGSSALMGAGGMFGIPGGGLSSMLGLGGQTGLLGGLGSGLAGMLGMGGGGAGGAGLGLFGGGAGAGGGLGSMLGLGGGAGGGGGFLSTLLGAGGLPQLASTVLGYGGARRQERRESETGDIQRSLLGQGRELAELSPEARKAMLARAKESIRASQAERGIFTSGVGAAAEAEQLPLIEAQLNQLALQNLINISGAYGQAY